MTSVLPVPTLSACGSLRLHAEALAAANINPLTGLATDYLNHFNEAIMLLDMVADMPECAEDFLDWRPLTYSEHFQQSNFAARDLAIAAYEAAPPKARNEFDTLCGMLTETLVAVRDAMMQTTQESTRQQLAGQATEWLKPMVVRAGHIINAGDIVANEDSPQADIDIIMSA